MTFPRDHKVSPQESSRRIDLILLKAGAPVSRVYLQRLIREGRITVDGRRVKPSQRLQTGQVIRIEIPPPVPIAVEPEPIPLDVLFEDEAIIVINKPPGLVVHPAPGHYTGTLVNALLHHCKGLGGIGGVERPGIVHRLDKETSGVMIVAKIDTAHRNLSRQFKDRTIRKIYLALIAGVPKKKVWKIDLAIGRDRRDRKKISVRTEKPRSALSSYRVLSSFGDSALVEIRPETGRTHQIRVHLSALGHPVFGDKAYGGRHSIPRKNLAMRRQMLHAYRLGICHPLSAKRMEFTAPPPEDLRTAVETLSGRGWTEVVPPPSES
jgi:23S rRNA pseudouridine1911/1915/1917 synthase